MIVLKRPLHNKEQAMKKAIAFSMGLGLSLMAGIMVGDVELKRIVAAEDAAPTAKQSEMLNVWRGELGYGYDMIARAFEECLDRTGKVQMNYINKVLSNWRDSGFEKPSDIVSKPKKADDGAKKTSYDLDKFEKASLKTPVYRKKGAK